MLVVLVGDGGVGKTQLAYRSLNLVKFKWNTRNYIKGGGRPETPTIGVEFGTKIEPWKTDAG